MTLAREHTRLLEMAYETFSRQWGTQLSSRLRVDSQVTLESVTMQTYDEYVRALPVMTAMVLCPVESTRATAVVQLPIGAAMTWVDLLLGGRGEGEHPEREFTEIELTLVREVLQSSLGDLGYAFAAVMPLDVRVSAVQYNPQFVQAVGASEPVIIATFSLRVGTRQDTATFMLPADLLLTSLRTNEHVDGRTAEEIAASEVAMADLAASVQDVPVDVSVQFRPLTVHPRDVLELSVGDVLTLPHPTARPLDVVVDDVVLAHAAVGSNGARLACMVVTAEETTA